MTREEAKIYIGELKTYANSKGWDEEYLIACDIAINKLEQEPRKGKWISKPHIYGVTYCSECDFELKIDDTNYCPNCGANMKEVNKYD